MKLAFKALGCGIAITALSVLLSFGLNWKSAIWLLWPGILFHRVAFRNYYAESHLVGWPSTLEIVSILAVSFIVYSVVAWFIIRNLAPSNSRSSASSA